MSTHYTRLFIGLDVHKDTITIAVAKDGRNGEVRDYGTIPNNMNSLNKAIRKFVSTGAELYFVYEAGPCGFYLYHHLTGNGFKCIVAAPTQIPKKDGDRIKNDRRDARKLARSHRAGELTAVNVPHPEDEALRDLCRAREHAKKTVISAKQRLKAFLLRHNIVYTGRGKWSKAFFNWLSSIKMSHPAQHIALQEYIEAIEDSINRLNRITNELSREASQWRLYPVVQALQALRGVSFISSITSVAEVGDLRRFNNPQEVMAYLGLVPSEHSSGNKTKRGSITKQGNSHARRAVVESAWSYRLPARITRALRKRQENLPKNVKDIAWKAQVRLCSRFRRLSALKKPKQVVVTAIARELTGFMWAIAQVVPIAA